MLTQEQITEIKTRAENATYGPWKVADNVKIYSHHTPDCRIASCWRNDLMNRAQSNEDVSNAVFIAHARTDIPALLRHIETLESQMRATEQITPADH